MLGFYVDLSAVLNAGDTAMNNTDGFCTFMEMTLKRDRQEKKIRCQVTKNMGPENDRGLVRESTF